MKFTKVFHIISLASAHSATANLHGNGGRGGVRGKGKQGGGKGGGRDEDQSKTVIVEIKKDTESEKNDTTTLASDCADVAAAVGGEVAAVYDMVLNGCAIEVPSQAASAAMATMNKNPRVMMMEEDQKVYMSYSWGQDRVDQCDLPLGREGSPLSKVDASGVRVYILDTGIDMRHNEFNGMIDPDSGCHGNFADDGTSAFEDGHGHGTHVAGTACGANYGVATCDTLCAIRVLGNDGSGSSAGVINGINHAVKDCTEAFPGQPRKCVANMSLGGGYSSLENKAVADAIDQGVVMVVAAGNSNDNACGHSPASEPKAITVGSTRIDDTHSEFSCFGPCVDVYAPGSDIVSARAGSTGGTDTFSGTSMASPHVAGIVAGILGEDAGADVDARLKANAKFLSDKAQDGSDQLLANTVAGGCGGAPPPAPTASPVPCTQSVIKVAITTDGYPAETGWALADQCGGNGGPSRPAGYYTSPGTSYEDEYCLPGSRYKFSIQDSYGDGLCCEFADGKYEVLVDNVSQFVGGEFGYEMDHEFGSCDPSSTPPPAPPPAPPTPCSVVKVKILTDEYGGETTWDLVDQCDGSPVGSGGPYDRYEEVEVELCRPEAQYKFTIKDLYGDGMCCTFGSGTYEVLVGGESQFVGGTFGSKMEHVFGSCGPSSTPSPATTPPTSMSPTQCAVIGNWCIPGPPDYDPQGAVCGNDGQPDEAYCNYLFGPNACVIGCRSFDPPTGSEAPTAKPTDPPQMQPIPAPSYTPTAWPTYTSTTSPPTPFPTTPPTRAKTSKGTKGGKGTNGGRGGKARKMRKACSDGTNCNPFV